MKTLPQAALSGPTSVSLRLRCHQRTKLVRASIAAWVTSFWPEDRAGQRCQLQYRLHSLRPSHIQSGPGVGGHASQRSRPRTMAPQDRLRHVSASSTVKVQFRHQVHRTPHPAPGCAALVKARDSLSWHCRLSRTQVQVGQHGQDFAGCQSRCTPRCCLGHSRAEPDARAQSGGQARNRLVPPWRCR
jgi:hypothetical protein